MDLLNVLADYNGTVYRTEESHWACSFWLKAPQPNEGVIKTVFFRNCDDCNRFTAEQANQDHKPQVFDLRLPKYDEQFNYPMYGVVSENLREAFKLRLLSPAKKHLTGRVLTLQEAEERIRQGLSATVVSRTDKDGNTIAFFTNNHIFGYTILPADFTTCSHYLPQEIAPRPGFEDGWLTTIEGLIKLYYSDAKMLWDIEALLDELNIPEE